MALQQSYHVLWFVSIGLPLSSGHRHQVHLRLKPKQNLPAEIAAECKAATVDPFLLLTECKSDYVTNYPVGTEFLLKAKLTDRKGRTMFFYNSYRWQAFRIVKPRGRNR